MTPTAFFSLDRPGYLPSAQDGSFPSIQSGVGEMIRKIPTRRENLTFERGDERGDETREEGIET
jgi:hypothetical protein